MHNSENINRRKDVEDLEDDVPWYTFSKQVEVPGTKDKGVKDLRDEGDTLGASVSVDSEDEDTFREGVGQIAQNTEELREVVSLASGGCMLGCRSVRSTRPLSRAAQA